MLFREHLCTRFWHRLGLQSCWGSGVSQPCPRCSTRRFHGTGRSIHTSMALPCMPSISALYCIVCLEFSGSEDAISRASLRTLLAPPWAWILLRIRCFATMPHNAPHGVSMVLAGPSGHLWPMALPSMPFRKPSLFSGSEDAISRASLRTALRPWAWILRIRNYAPRCSTRRFHGTTMAIYAAPKMLFREHLCTRFWHRHGWGSGVSQPCPRCSTGLFHGTGRSIQTSMALPSMPCTPCIAFCLAVPKMLFREHLCARFWHRLGLNPAGDPVFRNACPTDFRNHAPQLFHSAFPWYWPVHLCLVRLVLPSV